MDGGAKLKVHTIIDLKSKIYESAIDPDVILYHHTHSTYNACLKILMNLLSRHFLYLC